MNSISDKSDAEILALIKEDLQYFSIFYEKYLERIYRYCNVKMNFDKTRTEDIVSEVFLKAVENIQKFDLEKSRHKSILPWLYTIARNLIYDSWKGDSSADEITLDSENEEIITDDFHDDSSIEKLEARMDRGLLLDTIKNQFNHLDKISVDIIYLKIYEEMTFQEIANSLDLQESAVKMRYYRALSKVTTKLKEQL